MLPIPSLDPGTVDPSEAAFASGMLAGIAPDFPAP